MALVNTKFRRLFQISKLRLRKWFYRWVLLSLAIDLVLLPWASDWHSWLVVDYWKAPFMATMLLPFWIYFAFVLRSAKASATAAISIDRKNIL